MIPATPDSRRILFLQGPHGPFFSGLAKMLRVAGAQVWRVGFNAGDAAFWRGSGSYIPYRGTVEEWPQAIDALLDSHGITDIALYGDTRPVHAAAVAAAKARDLRIHVFEEGYLRPYWVTYERDGSNGHSRLMDMDVAEMRQVLERSDPEAPLPPSHWGDMSSHIFYGAAYHWFVMFLNRGYRNFRPHRELSVARELRLYLRRLVMLPFHVITWRIQARRIKRGGFPYHLALMQLEHDSSFRVHSPFSSMQDFLEEVIGAFAEGAPRHHHLVVKAHPLETGRVPLRREVLKLARNLGVADRVHYLHGGKLGRLLDDARSAVTVNSTAGQQVLWRGIPLKTFGRAVYSKPEFVSDQPLDQFFAGATRPDARAYKDYRRYLLETSQVPGGYYSHSGRRQLLRHVVDMMLADEDPYDALKSGTAAPRQHLRLVK
ncbi:capsule biosynthesis protein [Chachezhania sediminis]|uniref:capsule biosynthesis protein n=1 Tax=Chachezhania sediminis TaxID=2599291 RepID=UPI00131C0809|nr:capsule biosynthesis protein CapA [Chachezhania sediminis]